MSSNKSKLHNWKTRLKSFLLYFPRNKSFCPQWRAHRLSQAVNIYAVFKIGLASEKFSAVEQNQGFFLDKYNIKSKTIQDIATKISQKTISWQWKKEAQRDRVTENRLVFLRRGFSASKFPRGPFDCMAPLRALSLSHPSSPSHCGKLGAGKWEPYACKIMNFLNLEKIEIDRFPAPGTFLTPRLDFLKGSALENSGVKCD